MCSSQPPSSSTASAPSKDVFILFPSNNKQDVNKNLNIWFSFASFQENDFKKWIDWNTWDTTQTMQVCGHKSVHSHFDKIGYQTSLCAIFRVLHF